MQIVRDLAGYSLGRSDLVRRAMSKKKHDVMAMERKNFIYGIEENGEVIVDGALRRGVSREAAEQIFDEMMDFASYAFNKAHAACYAVVAYRTALLKCLYPVEFMTALINSFLTAPDKIASYIFYCRRRGIKVLPPDINRSEARFSVEASEDGGESSIRFGLAAIRNVGEGAMNDALAEREGNGEFADFTDFIKRAPGVNKRLIEGLILAGCFDSFGVSRKYLMAHYEVELAAAGAERKRIELGQLSLFDLGADEKPREKTVITAEMKEEFSRDEKLMMEREAVGIYISGHPLADYEAELAKLKNNCLELSESDDSGAVRDGERVCVGGFIASVSTRLIKSGAGVMATGRLEDMTGSIEFLAFPTVYQRYSSLLSADKRVIVSGRLSMREDRANTVMIDDVQPLSKGGAKRLALNFTEETQQLEGRVVEMMRRYPGSSEVAFCYAASGKRLLAPKELSVNLAPELLEGLTALLGEQNVRVVTKKA